MEWFILILGLPLIVVVAVGVWIEILLERDTRGARKGVMRRPRDDD